MDSLDANDQPGVHPGSSYYTATAMPFPALPPLEGDRACDVCLIGGGYTGLSAALHLAEAGQDVVLIDAHRVGWGASGRNGGQVGSGQRLDQLALESLVGQAEARALWTMAEDAKALVHDRIARHAIPCAYRPGVLHADHRRRFLPHSRALARRLREAYGYTAARMVEEDEIRQMLGSRGYVGGVLDRGAGHLHPLTFALGLAQAARAAGADLRERTRALAVAGGDPAEVVTDRGRIRARAVILAGNGYLGHLDRRVAERVLPINNFLIATEPLAPDLARSLIRDDVAVADSRFVINYFRLSEDRRLLFGGGESYGFRFPADIAGLVRPIMLRVFPQLTGVPITHAWGGTLGITLRRLPHVARLEPGLWSAAGYSGHGVALATYVGALLAEAVTQSRRGQPPGPRFDQLARLPVPRFPGGTRLRHPLLVLAMTYGALRDRL